MPERLTSNRKVIGTKQLRKALKAGRVRTAYVAADADPILREPLVEQCRDAGVELVEIATMKELGRLCGIHVAQPAPHFCAEMRFFLVPTEYL